MWQREEKFINYSKNISIFNRFRHFKTIYLIKFYDIFSKFFQIYIQNIQKMYLEFFQKFYKTASAKFLYFPPKLYLELSRQEECRTPVTEYRSTEAGNGKNLTRTGTTLLSTDIDRSTEHQYMDTPTDTTHLDPATRKPDKNLLQLVEKRRT